MQAWRPEFKSPGPWAGWVQQQASVAAVHLRWGGKQRQRILENSQASSLATHNNRETLISDRVRTDTWGFWALHTVVGMWLHIHTHDSQAHTCTQTHTLHTHTHTGTENYGDKQTYSCSLRMCTILQSNPKYLSNFGFLKTHSSPPLDSSAQFLRMLFPEMTTVRNNKIKFVHTYWGDSEDRRPAFL